jgi:hypothetical protein
MPRSSTILPLVAAAWLLGTLSPAAAQTDCREARDAYATAATTKITTLVRQAILYTDEVTKTQRSPDEVSRLVARFTRGIYQRDADGERGKEMIQFYLERGGALLPDVKRLDQPLQEAEARLTKGGCPPLQTRVDQLLK